MEATAEVFLDSKLGPADEELCAEDELTTDDELTAEETLATEDAELVDTTTEPELTELEIIELDTTDTAELDTTELAITELESTEDKEPGSDEPAVGTLDVETVLDADNATELAATEVALDEGISEGEGLLLFPPPPQATKLHKVTLHTIARAPERRRKPFDINMNVSELL